MGSRGTSWAAAILLLLAAAPAAAQSYAYVEPSPRNLEITPFAGLFWSTQVNTSNGSVVFDAAPDFGATLGIQVDGKSQIEILYAFARPQARFQSTSPFYASSPSFGVTTQYLQLGGLTTFQQGSVEPFLAGGLGMAWFHPSDVQVPGAATIQPADTWLFAFNLGLGVKWFLSDAIGLRIEARAFMPVYLNSGTFLSGPNGAELRVNAGVPLVQGDLGLGLAIALP
jgi:opacity protein-like surface antigen